MTPPRPPEGTPSPCECRIMSLDLAVDYKGPMKAGPYISYCPLHASAPKLVAALEESANYIEQNEHTLDYLEKIASLLQEARCEK